MDGGLDGYISKKFGYGIQRELQRRIRKKKLGELLVGDAEIIESSGPYIICAPTMRVPDSQGIPDSVNAYLAMKAILVAGLGHPKIHSIGIWGLCTGSGRMLAITCARQMHQAYREIIHQETPEFPMFMDAVKFHRHLKSPSY